LGGREKKVSITESEGGRNDGPCKGERGEKDSGVILEKNHKNGQGGGASGNT